MKRYEDPIMKIDKFSSETVLTASTSAESLEKMRDIMTGRNVTEVDFNVLFTF